MTEKQYEGFFERRRFLRYEVRYRAKVCKDDEDLCGTVVDISEGGVGILLPHIVPVGTELELEIGSLMPGEGLDKITFTAKIMWMQDEEFVAGMYRGGMEISHISEKDLQALHDHIQYLDEKKQDE